MQLQGTRYYYILNTRVSSCRHLSPLPYTTRGGGRKTAGCNTRTPLRVEAISEKNPYRVLTTGRLARSPRGTAGRLAKRIAGIVFYTILQGVFKS